MGSISKSCFYTNLKIINLAEAFLTQVAEYLHGKQKVAGSNPAKG